MVIFLLPRLFLRLPSNLLAIDETSKNVTLLSAWRESPLRDPSYFTSVILLSTAASAVEMQKLRTPPSPPSLCLFPSSCAASASDPERSTALRSAANVRFVENAPLSQCRVRRPGHPACRSMRAMFYAAAIKSANIRTFVNVHGQKINRARKLALGHWKLSR